MESRLTISCRSSNQKMREIGPFNARIRGRTKTCQRRDYFTMLHREYDSRPAHRIVMDSIEIALGNDGLAMMTGTIY